MSMSILPERRSRVRRWIALPSLCWLVAQAGFSQLKQSVPASAHAQHHLVFDSAITLGKVQGGFDLMAVDLERQRLFVSAEDNHTVEVVDLKARKPLASIPNQNEPKWVVYRPDENVLYVATGKDGRVTGLDATTYKVKHTFQFKEKCNNLRYDPSARELYVGVGNTFGSLGIIDLKTHRITGEIGLADYPKQFELDGNKVYVNIPSKNVIQVVDRAARKVVAVWQVKESKENVPMALDREHGRLFIGCEPGKFIVYSTSTGKSIASLDINKGADGIYYDAKRQKIYVSTGEGFLNVLSQITPDQYQLVGRINTVEGAGTSLFVPQLDLFILATPQAGNRQAALRLYRPAP
jgi:DNA-binding beta-propeller fold protein YncE